MRQLDPEVIRQLLDSLNQQYLKEYLSTSDQRDILGAPSSPVPSLDKNNPLRYGEEYFDLAVANLLLRELNPQQYPLSANLAELISRLGYDGLRRCDILLSDSVRLKFCNQIAFNQTPNLFQVMTYLLWIEQYDHNALPIWFYYTLLLWVLLTEKHHHQYGYRSRILLGISIRYGVTQVSDFSAERKHDVLRIQEPMCRLIRACCKHEFPTSSYTEFTPFILSTLREFSVLTLATMIARSSHFEELRPLGVVTKARHEKFHQMVVDRFYQKHRNA